MSQPPSLTLEATGPESETLREHRKTFGPEGGTIGRAPQCHWVLADDYVSRQHARVTYRNGEFFIEDTASTSGVYLNDQRLPSEQPHPVRPGDRLLIEPYDILVAPSAVAGVPLGNAPKPFGLPANTPGGADLLPDLPLESMVDPIKALFGEPSQGAPPRSESRPAPPASLGGGVLKEVAAVAAPRPEPVSPPARELPAKGIPVDWDKPAAVAQRALQSSPSPLPWHRRPPPGLRVARSRATPRSGRRAGARQSRPKRRRGRESETTARRNCDRR